MAGRGCTVKVQVLNPSRGGEAVDEIFLPVALHSPLLVFKQRLAECSDIEVDDQVLIFCDLTDPDRNSDVVLNQDYDNISLRDCNFTADSLLTLHALGMSAERRAAVLREASTNAEAERQALVMKTKDTTIIATPTTAANADHSFNGIIFDVVAKGAYEVQVTSISLAGMLGRVRIFARDRPWAEGQPRQQQQHYWGHHPGVANTGWKLVADQVCKPSWDRPTEIFFDESFTLLPHERKAFYCHSGLPHDLGIQYQSIRAGVVSCQDECMAILPGLGHCGSTPFDGDDGWFRHARSPCGMVRYKAKMKGYHVRDHKIFPLGMREAAKTLLGCYYSARMARRSPLSSSSPRYRPPNTPTITEVVWCPNADVNEAAGAGDGKVKGIRDRAIEGVSNPPSTTSDGNSSTSTQSSSRRMRRNDSEEEAFLMEQADCDYQMDTMFGSDEEVEAEAEIVDTLNSEYESGAPMDATMFQENDRNSPAEVEASSLSLQIPKEEEEEEDKNPYVYPAFSIINEKYLIYNILEFCHWDWFEEVAAKKAKAAAEERRANGIRGDSESESESESEDEDRRRPPRRSPRIIQGTQSAAGGEDMNGAIPSDLRHMVAQMLASYGIPDDDDVVTMFMNRIVTGQTAGDSEVEDAEAEDGEEMVEESASTAGGERGSGTGTSDLPSFFTGIGDNDPHIYDEESYDDTSEDASSGWSSGTSEYDDIDGEVEIDREAISNADASDNDDSN